MDFCIPPGIFYDLVNMEVEHLEIKMRAESSETTKKKKAGLNCESQEQTDNIYNSFMSLNDF